MSCPVCGSDDPAKHPLRDRHGEGHLYATRCPDPFHTGLEDQGDGVSEGVVPSPATEGTSVLSGACTEGRDHVPETAPIGPLADSDPEDQGGEGEAECSCRDDPNCRVHGTDWDCGDCGLEDIAPAFTHCPRCYLAERRWGTRTAVIIPAEASGVGAEDGRVWTIRHDPDYGKSWVDGPVQKNTLDVVPRTLLTQAEGERDQQERFKFKANVRAEALATRLSAVEEWAQSIREMAESASGAELEVADRCAFDVLRILDSTESPSPNPEEGRLREALERIAGHKDDDWFKVPEEEMQRIARTALGDGGRDE